VWGWVQTSLACSWTEGACQGSGSPCPPPHSGVRSFHQKSNYVQGFGLTDHFGLFCDARVLIRVLSVRLRHLSGCKVEFR